MVAAPYGVVAQTQRSQHFRLIEISAVEYDGIAEFLLDQLQVRTPEFLPLSYDCQGIRAVERRI
jgi:hypothetical protein